MPYCVFNFHSVLGFSSVSASYFLSLSSQFSSCPEQCIYNNRKERGEGASTPLGLNTPFQDKSWFTNNANSDYDKAQGPLRPTYDGQVGVHLMFFKKVFFLTVAEQHNSKHNKTQLPTFQDLLFSIVLSDFHPYFQKLMYQTLAQKSRKLQSENLISAKVRVNSKIIF